MFLLSIKDSLTKENFKVRNFKPLLKCDVNVCHKTWNWSFPIKVQLDKLTVEIDEIILVTATTFYHYIVNTN